MNNYENIILQGIDGMIEQIMKAGGFRCEWCAYRDDESCEQSRCRDGIRKFLEAEYEEHESIDRLRGKGDRRMSILDTVSDDAREQWNSNGTDDYRHRIKSCYNCDNWAVDYTLSTEYAFNHCRARLEEPLRSFRFDMWCPRYDGYAEESNLVYEELWKVVSE